MLLLKLLDEYRSFLVLAALVLEPDTDDSWTQASHFNELFLHQSVRSWVGAVASAQRVKLLLVQYCPYPRRLLVGTFVRPRPTAVFRCRCWRRSTSAVAAAATVLTGRLTNRSCCIVRLCNKIRSVLLIIANKVSNYLHIAGV